MRPRKVPPLLLMAVALAACTVGPDYVRPPMQTPPAFKDVVTFVPPNATAVVDDGDWWTRYQDAYLDSLLARVTVDNQNVKAMEARYRAALAQIELARAGYYPTVSAAAAGTFGQAQNSQGSGGSRTNNTQAGGSAGWTIDVWGQVRRSVEASTASAEASAADLAAAALSAKTLLAQSYFGARIAELTKRQLDDAVEAYRQSYRLVTNQYAAGTASQADLSQSEAQLRSTEASATDVDLTRAQYENAIAVLIGVPPADFNLPRGPLPAEIPDMPAAVPSELLQRRPDIGAAERTMAMANAQIGVAVSAYYPSFNLSATLGMVGAAFMNWLSLPGTSWSAGASVTQLVYDGGARSAQVDIARANYDTSIANYRQTVLSAFQEVEDNLAALRILAEEARHAAAAVEASRRSQALVQNQYRAGTVGYLNVLIAQTQALNNELSAINIRGRRLAASVQLIRALGGGWQPAPPKTP